MSIGPDLSIDPAAEYLERGATADYVEPEGAEPHTRVSVVIAAGLLASFALVAKALSEHAPPPTPGAAVELVNEIWGKVTPAWMRMSIEAFRYAIELGSTKGLSHADVTALAESYAGALGDYANTTSAAAVGEGFAAQLNAGWDPGVAWRRASMGYGLDERGMKGFITPLLIRPTSYRTVEIPPENHSMLVKMLRRRAMGLADNESYHASQLGKTLVWQFQRNQGLLPEDAMKVWRTARDEKVCAICGPVDGQTVGLDEMFELASGQLVCPGAHPNCRCTVELSYSPFAPRELAKAYGKDPDTRDADGRWAKVEGRGLKRQPALKPTKPAHTRVRERNPEPSPEAAQIAAMLAEAAKVSEKAEEAVTSMVPATSMVRATTMAPSSTMARATSMVPATSMVEAEAPTMARGMTRTMTPDTDFGAMVRAKSTKRHITHIFWLPGKGEDAPREEEDHQEEEVEPADLGDPAYQENTLVLNAADYFQAVANHMQSKEGKDRFDHRGRAPFDHPLFTLREGSVVNFDATGLGRHAGGVDAQTSAGWISPGMKGLADELGHQGANWIPTLANYKAYQNKIGSLDAWKKRNYIEERADEQAYELRDWDEHGGGDGEFRRGGPLAYLSDQQINHAAVLARKYGAKIPPARWKGMAPDQRRAWVFEQWDQEKPIVYDRDNPWEDALSAVTGDLTADELRDQIVGTEMQDSTVDDVEPDLFVFHDHYGPSPDILEGKYLVDRVEFHNLDNNQRVALDDEIAEQDYPDSVRFKTVRVFHLTPYEPPWVPQTPMQYAAGASPIDDVESDR